MLRHPRPPTGPRRRTRRGVARVGDHVTGDGARGGSGQRRTRGHHDVIGERDRRHGLAGGGRAATPSSGVCTAASAAVFGCSAGSAGACVGATEADPRGVAGFLAAGRFAAGFAAEDFAAEVFAVVVFAAVVLAAVVFAAVVLDGGGLLRGGRARRRSGRRGTARARRARLRRGDADSSALSTASPAVADAAEPGARRGVRGVVVRGVVVRGVEVRGARGVRGFAGVDAEGSTLSEPPSAEDEEGSGDSGSEAVIAPNYQRPPTPPAGWSRGAAIHRITKPQRPARIMPPSRPPSLLLIEHEGVTFR